MVSLKVRGSFTIQKRYSVTVGVSRNLFLNKKLRKEKAGKEQFLVKSERGKALHRDLTEVFEVEKDRMLRCSEGETERGREKDKENE